MNLGKIASIILVILALFATFGIFYSFYNPLKIECIGGEFRDECKSKEEIIALDGENSKETITSYTDIFKSDGRPIMPETDKEIERNVDDFCNKFKNEGKELHPSCDDENKGKSKIFK